MDKLKNKEMQFVIETLFYVHIASIKREKYAAKLF